MKPEDAVILQRNLKTCESLLAKCGRLDQAEIEPLLPCSLRDSAFGVIGALVWAYREVTDRELALDVVVGCAKDFHRQLDAAQSRITALEAAATLAVERILSGEVHINPKWVARELRAAIAEGKKGPVGKKPEVASPPPANETEAQDAHD
jgi:hypothetical protein